MAINQSHFFKFEPTIGVLIVIYTFLVVRINNLANFDRPPGPDGKVDHDPLAFGGGIRLLVRDLPEVDHGLVPPDGLLPYADVKAAPSCRTTVGRF